MISLTRLNGDRIAVNADLIERAEETPDTVLTLTNGTKYVVAESLDELLHKIQVNRAGILALAGQMAVDELPAGEHRLRLVSGFPHHDTRAVIELDDLDDDEAAEILGGGAPGGGADRPNGGPRALAAGRPNRDGTVPESPTEDGPPAAGPADEGGPQGDTGRAHNRGGRWHR